jgi:hypothetical protein
MTYQKKVKVLAILTGSLALVYAALLVFNPDRVTTRNTYYTWLDARAAEQAERIELGGENPISLVKRDGLWRVVYEGEEYPARESRVEDLFAALRARESYPVRGNSASAHDRLGLGDDAANRITLWRGVAEEPLFDLIAGGYDVIGREVYYRRAGRDEVRSGAARIFQFLDLPRTSWYDLRLFPESQDVSVDAVSRLTILPPTGEGAAALVINRDAAGWFIEGLDREKTDVSKIEPAIRAVMSAEGDDYTAAGDDDFSSGRILVEVGGQTLYIRLGAELPPEEGTAPKRRARISPSNRVVALSSWTIDRLFRNAAYFTLSEAEE